MLILWKSLVLPSLKYYCHLWSPYKTGHIMKLEALQRTFTSRIAGLEQLNYWELLQELKLYTLQRRHDRYIVIYVWKTLEGHVPNVAVEERLHSRRGRLCLLKSTEATTHRTATLVHNSFFNAFPKAIRNTRGVSTDSFKGHNDGQVTYTRLHQHCH